MSMRTCEAVKESSADVRRVAAIRELLGDRLSILVGVDDAIVEGVSAGAVGWIAGLVNAFPARIRRAFRSGVRRRDTMKPFELYRLVSAAAAHGHGAEVCAADQVGAGTGGRGSARVRPPRLELEGDELMEAQRTLQKALAGVLILSAVSLGAHA